jgi:hypothetical protein
MELLVVNDNNGSNSSNSNIQQSGIEPTKTIPMNEVPGGSTFAHVDLVKDVQKTPPLDPVYSQKPVHILT